MNNDLSQWQTYSHTHRSFVLQNQLSDQLIQQLHTVAHRRHDEFEQIVFVQDPTVIEALYQLSSLPQDDQYRFNNFVHRKNSQLLAPLLIMIIPHHYTHQSLAAVGELYSQLAHTAIGQGCETGFCICFEKVPAAQLLLDHGLTSQLASLGSIPFLAIGHHDATVPHNFQRRDLGHTVGTYTKQPIDSYITVT